MADLSGYEAKLMRVRHLCIYGAQNFCDGTINKLPDIPLRKRYEAKEKPPCPLMKRGMCPVRYTRED